jgi:hypothetical protein
MSILSTNHCWQMFVKELPHSSWNRWSQPEKNFMLIKARYKHWSLSNRLQLEHPLQTWQQSNGHRKSPLPILTDGPHNVARSSRNRRRRFTTLISNIDLTLSSFFWCPLPKLPVGLEKQSFSRERWLVVVTVVVWCPLRILLVLRRAWNRRVSFRWDIRDAVS